MARDDDPRVPAISRIARGPARPARTLSRFRTRERFPRERRQRPVAELMGRLIERWGLTDACRQHCLCLYWNEIVGRFAKKTWPVRFADGVLHVETESSSWVQELQFHKAALLRQIDAWVAANQIWLGPPPLATDLRFELGNRGKQTPIVPRAYVDELRARHLRRLSPRRETTRPTVSAEHRAAIQLEVQAVADPELRALIESVRVQWDR